MNFVYDDGGRKAAGYSGNVGDCVTRALAIVSRRPYQEIYDALTDGLLAQRNQKGVRRLKSARDGVTTGRKWFRAYVASLGLVWTPTMAIGSGCKVHLLPGELPMGRLAVVVSKHWTSVIDGDIHDTHNPQRSTFIMDGAGIRTAFRCVYGYWRLV